MQRKPAKTQARNQSAETFTAAKEYASNNPTFMFWAVTNIAAAVLSIIPAPGAPYIAAATAGASNAGVAVSLVAKKRIDAAERADKLDRSKFQAEMTRLNEDRDAITKVQRDVATKESQLAAIEASLATQQRTMKDRMMVEAHKEAQAKVDAMQARLDVALADKAAMQATYQVKSTEMAKKTGLIVSKVQKSHKDLGDVAAKTIATGNEVLSKERTQVNGVLQNLEANVKAMAAELAAQKKLVADLQAPKHLPMKTTEAVIMNEVQTYLSTQKGVVLTCVDLGKIHYGLTPMIFEALGCGIKQVQETLSDLQTFMGWDEIPTAKIEGGKVVITAQLSSDKSPVASKDIVIVDPPLSKLEAAVNASIHLRIVSQSGGGKTTLLGNLINYLVGRISDDYTLSDPKVTDPKNWGNLKPDYFSRECLGHFFGLTETCLVRIDEAAESVKAGHGLPDFEMQFHVIDELEFLYGLSEVSKNKDHNSKLFKLNAKSMLKVGREHKMKMLFVTQSPLPSDLNLRKNDFENCSSIFLGSQISAGLNATDKDDLLKDVPPEKIAQLKAEYRARTKRGDKWLYLFFNPAAPEETFFGKCPDVNHYAKLKGYEPPSDGDSRSAGFEGGALKRSELAENGQTVATHTGAPAAESEGKRAVEGNSAKSGQGAQGQKGSLADKLAQGTYCPDCSHHTTSYKRKKPSATGKVSLRCKNKECDRDSFSWQII